MHDPGISVYVAAMVVFLISLVFVSAANAAIYVCEDKEVATFTDLDCHQTPYDIRSPSRTRFAPLTDTEITQLETIDARQDGLEQKRRKSRRLARSQRLRTTEAALELCAEARRDLRALGVRRRQGYPASEAKSLDAREARYEETIRTYC